MRKTIVGLMMCCLLSFSACSSSDEKESDPVEDSSKQEQLEKKASRVLEGKVKIPETYFKTKEEVTSIFKAAGLTPEFVVTNFDDKATTNKRYLKTGECDQIITDQPSVQYFDTNEVGDKFGFYADKGSTITVGYSDHDFDGTGKKKESSSASTKEKSENQETTENKVEEMNKNWYAEDSQYATLESVKRTVDGQMEEIGVDDPVRSIVVNSIQNYLSSSDESLEASDINRKLEYSRSSLYIDLRYDGREPDHQMIKIITDDLMSISGHKYTID